MKTQRYCKCEFNEENENSELITCQWEKHKVYKPIYSMQRQPSYSKLFSSLQD